jgi:hypothetical protein
MRNPDFKYIQFFMKPSLDEPLVYYMTNHQEVDGRKLSMFLKKFKSFLFENFEPEDSEKIIEDLNSHCLIYLDNSTGIHEVISMYENAFQANFKTLADINLKEPEDPYKSVRSKIIKSKTDRLSVFANKYSKSRRF